MKTLHVNIANKKAVYCRRGGDIVCGNSNYQIKFTFDAEWDAFSTKTARFVSNGEFTDVDFTGDTVAVPIMHNTEVLKVGVYAGDLRTTAPALIPCLRSILCLTDSPSTENDKSWANEAKEAAERAAEDARAEVTRLVGEIGVVQAKGTSPTAAMSQNAVTEELGKLYRITSGYKILAESAADFPTKTVYTTDGAALADFSRTTSDLFNCTEFVSIRFRLSSLKDSTKHLTLLTFFDADKNYISNYAYDKTGDLVIEDVASVPQGAAYVCGTWYRGKTEIPYIHGVYAEKGLTEQVTENTTDIDGLKTETEYLTSRINTVFDPITFTNEVNGDFGDAHSFTIATNVTHTIENNEVIISSVGGSTTGIYKAMPVIDKHKYYFAVQMLSHSNYTYQGILAIVDSTNYSRVFAKGTGEYELLSLIHDVDLTNSTSGSCDFRAYYTISTPSIVEGKEIKVKYATVIDLTAIYGEGKEPTKEDMDAILMSQDNWYIDGSIQHDIRGISEITRLEEEVVALKSIIRPTEDSKDVVNKDMTDLEFAQAIDAEFANYAVLCKCHTKSFQNLRQNTTLKFSSREQAYEIINHNFRRNVCNKNASFEWNCNAINSAFTIPVRRFQDGKLNLTNGVNASIELGLPTGEPSALISPQGTLYLWCGMDKLYESVDGYNFTLKGDPVLVNSPVQYVMHCSVNYADGKYYMIGTDSDVAPLRLYESTDGLNFEYKGIIFNVDEAFNSNGDRLNKFGNSFMWKETDGTWYLYYEMANKDRPLRAGYEISLATCTDPFVDNGDGTVGNWVQCPTNPVVPFMDTGVIDIDYTAVWHDRSNPEVARVNNFPVKVDGKYFMYVHSELSTRIRRLYSYDLVNWIDEGVILDVRDLPTGDGRSNADHCLIEYRGRTLMFYSHNINGNQTPTNVRLLIEDRPLIEVLRDRA